ncbi:MAG: aromatic aminobenezylarsenical efflux permease ArsG family transporter [Rikenellaceae bacterium]
MEIIQTWLDGSNMPIVTAFLLGILTAISPCPLATNITAIGFISKDIESRHKIFWNGILYTLGRIITYTVIGVILIPILQEGASIFKMQKAISGYGELLLSPALILIGLFMLFGSKLKLPSFGFKGGSDSGEKLKQRGGVGALLLGVLFALAFCPTSGVFYFGMLIPMSAGATGVAAYLYPLIFAVATGLPVIIVAWILAYSVSGMGKFYNNIRSFQKWFNVVVAITFIAVGIYYGITYYL